MELSILLFSNCLRDTARIIFRISQLPTAILKVNVITVLILLFSIIEADPANAGSFDNIETVCSNTDAIDLSALDNNDPAANTEGTFTGTGVTDNTFDLLLEQENIPLHIL